MALELKYTIAVDASQAKAEQKAVEDGFKQIDAAANKSAKAQTTWWQQEENAIEGVSETLVSHRKEVSKVETAVASLTTMTARTEQTAAKLTGTTTQATAALNAFGGGAGNVASMLLEMTGAAGLSVGALTALTGALGAALGAGILFGKFLADSAQYYVEHAKGAERLRKTLDELGDTWDAVKLMVGESLVAPEQSALIGFLKLGEEWALRFGLKIAADIELVQRLYALTPGGALMRRFGEANDLGDIPDPTKVLGGAHPVGSYFGWAAAGAGAYEPRPGSAAQAEFDREENERRRQALAAAREAERLERAIAEAYDRHYAALTARAMREAATLGLAQQTANFAAFGAYAAHLPMAAGFGIYGLNPRDLSPPTSDFFGQGKVRMDDLSVRGLDPRSLNIKGFVDFFGTAGSGGPSFLSRLFGKGGLVSDIGRVLEGLLVNRGSAGSAIGSSLGGSIFGAVAGDSTGGLTKMLTGSLGKTLGGALGSFLPFGGQILGSLIGNLFGPTKYQQEARQANKDIASMWAALNQQYGGGGDQALKIFGFNAAELRGKNYQGAMGVDPLKNVFDELSKKQASFNTDLGDTLTKIQGLGGNLSSSLIPYLDRLKDAKVLTNENLELIKQLSGDGKVDFRQMEEAARRLGVSTDKLGQSFQNARAEAQWQSVIDDLDTLKRGGADLDALFGDEGLIKTINDLVNQSIKFGTTIPENMKPWIQKLIDSGQLLGDNGEKIEDINKLKFGESMQTTLDHLNETLQKLIEALNVGVPDAAKRAGAAWREELGDLPTPGAGRARDTFVVPGGGDVVGPASGGTAIIQIDGRTIAEAVVPSIPGVVKLYGLAR